MSPLALLAYSGPRSAFRATCHYAYEESKSIHRRALVKFRKARALLLESMLREVENLLNATKGTTEASSPRNPGLDFAITALARGAHRSYEKYRTCNHRCEEFDSHYCTCMEHYTCFNCGRWLALAVYHDLHSSANPLIGREDGQLTRLGQLVMPHTRPFQPGTVGVKTGEVRYAPSGEHHVFGETWWRFLITSQYYTWMDFVSRVDLSRGVAIPQERIDLLVAWDQVMLRNRLRPLGWEPEPEASRPPTPQPPVPPPTPPARGLLSCVMM